MTSHSADCYRSRRNPTWCTGCSYYSVLQSLTDAFSQRGVDPHCITVVSGIGCSSRMPFFLNTFGLHTLHGRALPVAIGCRLARPDVPVVAIAGDGDLFSIGISHFVHAARRNLNCTVLCLDNRMFAMTKNQASPTSPKGHAGTMMPYGESSTPLNVIEFAIACGAAFVARTWSGSARHMKDVLVKALDHDGFSFVHILAPCRTFENSAEGAAVRQCVDINSAGNHDPADRGKALEAAAHSLNYDLSEGEPVPVGIFLEHARPVFEEQIAIQASLAQKRSMSSIIDDFSA